MGASIPRRRFLALSSGVVAGAALVGEARAAEAGPPPTIPALQKWTPGAGGFAFRTGARIVVDDAELRGVADVLGEDLRVPVVTGGSARTGDIRLLLADLGPERYELRVGPSIELRGTKAGVFLGTRTLVQWSRQAADIAGGVAEDWPTFPERGLLVANVAKHCSMTWWRGQIQELSYLKMNMLWLNVGYDSTPLSEIREIESYAARYNVALVPLVGVPDHMQRLLADRPELQLSGRPGSLDLSNPDAYAFARELTAARLAEFGTPHWHAGSDEYLLGADFADYPQLGEHARQRFGPEALPQDVHYSLINELNGIVRGAGKTMRIWNDGIFTNSTVKVDTNIVVEHWQKRDGRKTPQELIDAGYRISNANQEFLYHDEDPTRLRLNAQKIYERFRVTLFDGGLEVRASDSSKILGAKLHIWPFPQSEPEEFQSDTIAAPTRSLAQILWGSPKPAAYAAFEPLIAKVGKAPAFPRDRHRTLPLAGATSVPPQRPVTVTFHDAVSSPQLSLRDAAGAVVAGTAKFEGKTATFTPSAPLAWDASYTASVNAHSFSFRTASRVSEHRSLWQDVDAPAVESWPNTESLELGVKFRTDVPGQVLGVRFYKGFGNVGRHIGALWTGSGVQLASAVFGAESAAGWQEVRFATPVRISENTTYVASYLAPGGRYAVTQRGLASGRDSGVVHALPSGGVYHVGPGFPNSLFEDANYWVDLVFAPDVLSIWNTSDAPRVVSDDVSPVELGVRFQPDVDGEVLGVRFHRASGSAGTHVGALWTAEGRKLTAATFTAETPSGWQEVRFRTPVAIKARTTYVASYSAPDGRYGATPRGLASGRDNGVLHALPSGGVFRYALGAFPNQSYDASDYSVDVVFRYFPPRP